MKHWLELSMMNFRLSSDDFNRAVSTIKMGKRPQDAAQLVVVDGLSLGQVSKQLGISREAVRKSALRVKTAWVGVSGDSIDSVKRAAMGMLEDEMKHSDIPDDWEPVVVYLPKNMAKTIRNLERDKLQELDEVNAS